MGTTVTPNIGLIKPDGNEPGSNFPAQHGSNQDILDAEINSLKALHANNLQRRVATSETGSDSAGITTTETTVLSVTATLVAGKTYKVVFFGGFASSVVNDNASARIREDNASGTEMQNSVMQIPFSSGVPLNMPMEAEYTPGSSGSKTFVVSLVRLSGTGTLRLEAASTRKAYLYVDYVRG